MSSENDSLVAILADMLRSALTWEEKNAPSSSQTDLCDSNDVLDPYTSPSQTAQRIITIPKKEGKEYGKAEDSAKPPQ